MFLELCSHTSQNRHGCRFRSNAYKDVCLLRWRTYRKPISEFLEHLASYNGADMHKYNTLYTRTLSWHVLTPTSLEFRCQNMLSQLHYVYHVIIMHITTFGRCLVVLRALYIVQPQTAWMPAELQTAIDG